MNVNDVIAKLRVMLSSEEVVEKVEAKFAEAELVDGTQVYTEGELQDGAILFVRAGEGASEDPFAPAGVHETTDGKLITVGENGEITSIEDKAEEAPVEADAHYDEKKEEEIKMEEEEDIKVEVKEKDFDMDELIGAIAEIIKPQGEVIEELKKEVETLKERFNKVAGEPAAEPVRNTFSENKVIRDEMFAKRMDALAAIRKSK
jgi:hypothetical protein